MCVLDGLDLFQGPDGRDNRVPSCEENVEYMSCNEAASACEHYIS